MFCTLPEHGNGNVSWCWMKQDDVARLILSAAMYAWRHGCHLACGQGVACWAWVEQQQRPPCVAAECVPCACAVRLQALEAINTLNGTDLGGRPMLVREDREDRDVKQATGEEGVPRAPRAPRAPRGGRGGRGPKEEKTGESSGLQVGL